MRQFLYALLCVVALQFSTVAPSAANADLIKGEIIGKWWTFRGPFDGRLIYRKSGQVTIKLADGSTNAGKWRIKGNRLCTQLGRNFRSGREQCFSFRKINNRQYKSSHGYTLFR